MFVLLILVVQVFSLQDPFPIPRSFETDELLLALEAEVTRTIRDELAAVSATDDELQNLEGSGVYTAVTTPTTTTTTTTQKPTTTTKLMPKQCVHEQECYKDSECQQGGKCMGSELGICDCNACVTNRRCQTDQDCGGLENGCDIATGLCDCVKAFHTHGYNLFVKVLLTFCHQTKCSPTSNNCYGLPCRVGKCFCPQIAAQKSNLPVHYFTTGR